MFLVTRTSVCTSSGTVLGFSPLVFWGVTKSSFSQPSGNSFYSAYYCIRVAKTGIKLKKKNKSICPHPTGNYTDSLNCPHLSRCDWHRTTVQFPVQTTHPSARTDFLQSSLWMLMMRHCTIMVRVVMVLHMCTGMLFCILRCLWGLSWYFTSLHWVLSWCVLFIVLEIVWYAPIFMKCWQC